MHPAPDGVAAKQGRIADRTFYTNDRALLRHMLESGQGWPFCRSILPPPAGVTLKRLMWRWAIWR